MKTTALLPAAVLAYTAAAEMQLYAFPSVDKRDMDAVNTALSQISNAITQLDTSVQAFDKDGSKVKADAENLVSTIKEGASSVASSGAISLEEALGLQQVAAFLTTAGQKLVKDVQGKKAAFEASDVCEDVKSNIESLGSEAQTFVDAIIKQLPEESQQAAKQLTSGISASLTHGAKFFKCQKGADKEEDDEDYESSSSAVPVATTSALAHAYPTSSVPVMTPSETCVAITVTVTAPCDCGPTSSSSVPVLTPSSHVTSSSVPVTTHSTSVPYPTGANSTTIIPTGGVTTTSVPTGIATAGASSNGVGAAGLLAGLAAAFFV
ncbi:hydrophobic surface binding protein A-domain-containing protein [Xylaria bambusicola]|uniref:hydrophobic surface binding protein A-domain-containing protein n=1 Tax=Xylaria bambusicola TaxID=326684 RepID=UPI0020084E00|nr:hydrophobic surface binding protein A-domain-containing protein [Xylaria bambusicola]KAI0513337.1 hydrophobic surface binding protein A-domain-containing protein [Xylaria bambusicola]